MPCGFFYWVCVGVNMVSNWEEFPMHDDKCTLRMVCLACWWNFIDSSCVLNTLFNNPFKIKHQYFERLSSINQWWLKNLKDKTNCCVEIRNRHLHIFRWYFYGKPMSLGFRHFPILFPFNIHWCHYLLAGVHVRLKSWKNCWWRYISKPVVYFALPSYSTEINAASLEW